MSERERDAFEILSEGYQAKRVAASTPVVLERELIPQRREWPLEFGSVWAPAGAQTTIKIASQVIGFRGEKIMATDSGSPVGFATRILMCTVGQKVQRPAGGRGCLTAFFSETALANGVNFDLAEDWEQIGVTVSFVQACTFTMTIFGSACV
jgi:hypothetical protein